MFGRAKRPHLLRSTPRHDMHVPVATEYTRDLELSANEESECGNQWRHVTCFVDQKDYLDLRWWCGAA